MTTVPTREPARIGPVDQLAVAGRYASDVTREPERIGPVDHLAAARRYATDPNSWPLAPRFDPVRRWYHRIAQQPDFEVWLLSWLPGQGTDLHDHGDSSGAFQVVSGTLTEFTVRVAPTGGPPVSSGSRLTATQGRAFGTDHVHQIVNAGRRPAISVHVYGPALRTMTRYRIDGDRLHPVAVDRAGADW